MSNRTTPEHIVELGPNEVFVFGSNMLGEHMGGAARTAYEKLRLEHKQQIKDLMLELIGDDQALKWHIGDVTYGDTAYDAASADYGRYDLQQELRQKVAEL